MKRLNVIVLCMVMVLLSGCRFNQEDQQKTAFDFEIETKKELPVSTIGSDECYICGSNRNDL